MEKVQKAGERDCVNRLGEDDIERTVHLLGHAGRSFLLGWKSGWKKTSMLRPC